jgi:chromosome segregation ATPase
MGRHINELAEIVLDRVYKLGWQHRSDIGEGWKAADELVAAERKLLDAKIEQDKLALECETLRQERDLAQVETETFRSCVDSLRKDRDHWMQARKDAMAAGELMQAEIVCLRQQLADAQRAASAEFVERQVLQHEASDDYVELERLRAFAEVMRGLLTEEYADQRIIAAALAELDAGTIQPVPCPECETLRREIEEAQASGFKSMATALAEHQAATTEPTPVDETLDTEGGA